MKSLALAALALSCCAVAAGECTEVQRAETKPSSRNARIRVVLDGKPQGNAKLTVALPEGKGSRSFVTDSHGDVVVKDLPVGTDCITAVGENYLRAELCLAVSARSKSDISSFTLALVDMLRPAPAVGNVQAAEKNAAPERFRQLDGVVLDPAGGVAPHTEIDVYKRGSYPQNPVVKIWSDQEGRFTAPLNPDSYTIIFRSQGFTTSIRVIEISPDGREDRVRVILQIGTC